MKTSNEKSSCSKRSLHRALGVAIAALVLVQTAAVSGDAEARRRPRPPRPETTDNRGHGNGHGNGNANGHDHAPGQKKKAYVRPPAPGDHADAEAYALLQEEGFDVECDRLGNKIRKLSDRIVRKVERINNRLHNLDTMGLTKREKLREQNRRKVLLQLLENTQLWVNVWERLAEMYRSCDMQCFDDGDAVGEISGISYCAASVAAEGLPGPGYTFQPPLPLCQNSIAVGCQLGYRRAAENFEGCGAYSTGDYMAIFSENIGADCEVASLFE